MNTSPALNAKPKQLKHIFVSKLKLFNNTTQFFNVQQIKVTSVVKHNQTLHFRICTWRQMCIFVLFFSLTATRNHFPAHSFGEAAQPWMHYTYLDLRHINLDSTGEAECYQLTRSHLRESLGPLSPAVNNSWVMDWESEESPGQLGSESFGEMYVQLSHAYSYWLCATLARSSATDYKQNGQQDRLRCRRPLRVKRSQGELMKWWSFASAHELLDINVSISSRFPCRSKKWMCGMTKP